MNSWKVAAIRGGITALGTGALAALTVWTQTDDAKTIAIAGLTPALTIVVARFGVEGTLDSKD